MFDLNEILLTNYKQQN